jgi:hypothetical protein
MPANLLQAGDIATDNHAMAGKAAPQDVGKLPGVLKPQRS